MARINMQRAYGIEGVVGRAHRLKARETAERLGPYFFAQGVGINETPETQIISQVPAEQTRVNAA